MILGNKEIGGIEEDRANLLRCTAQYRPWRFLFSFATTHIGLVRSPYPWIRINVSRKSMKCQSDASLPLLRVMWCEWLEAGTYRCRISTTLHHVVLCGVVWGSSEIFVGVIMCGLFFFFCAPSNFGCIPVQYIATAIVPCS